MKQRMQAIRDLRKIKEEFLEAEARAPEETENGNP
jgi:hypothetical protein